MTLKRLKLPLNSKNEGKTLTVNDYSAGVKVNLLSSPKGHLVKKAKPLFYSVEPPKKTFESIVKVKKLVPNKIFISKKG